MGPRNKVQAQIKTFAKNGIELELVESPFKLDGPIRGNFLLRQLVSRLPFTYVYSKHEYEERFKDAYVIYIRFLAGDWYFTRFLKKLRENNPNAKIVMELADYPTTWYMATSTFYKLVYFPILLKDVFARRCYKRYIDRICMLKEHDSVYGIPVIRFSNGIDCDNITPRKPNDDLSVIRIIAVAAMCNFHGYERLIEGLHNYLVNGGESAIELHLVGGVDAPGNDVAVYKSLVNEYNLQEQVIFYGPKSGNELDEIYNRCNLAVASLGMYKIGYKQANSLKVREYLAKGLPIITGCDTDVFENLDFDKFIQFSNDETPIDFNRVIEFFDRVYEKNSPKDINDEISEFAKKYCDMSYAMKPVIDFLKE